MQQKSINSRYFCLIVLILQVTEKSCSWVYGGFPGGHPKLQSTSFYSRFRRKLDFMRETTLYQGTGITLSNSKLSLSLCF